MRLKSLPPPQQASFLLSFDFDDTLYDIFGPEKVPGEFFELIKDWRERFGIIWGINTGRSYDFLKEGYEEMAKASFAPDFVITMERNIHLADEHQYLRAFTSWNDQCKADHHALFTRHKSSLDKLFLEIEELFPHIGWWRQEDDCNSIEVEDPADLEGIAGYITEFLARHPDISVQRAGPYLRFCHAEYNKGTALQQVCVLTGMNPNKVCIFGDGYNDLDTLLINGQAHCAAPSNAVDTLQNLIRERGGYISSHSSSRGVMDALEKYVFPLISG